MDDGWIWKDGGIRGQDVRRGRKPRRGSSKDWAWSIETRGKDVRDEMAGNKISYLQCNARTIHHLLGYMSSRFVFPLQFQALHIGLHLQNDRTLGSVRMIGHLSSWNGMILE